MYLTSVNILNFKSIENITIDVKKIGNSFLTILLGLNEVGKSNILQAISFFNVPTESFDFITFQNIKDDDSEYIDIYFYLEFENQKTYLEAVKKDTENGELLKFDLNNICKNVYLKKGTTKFTYGYGYEVTKLPKSIFIKKDAAQKIILSKENDESSSFTELTEKNFNDFFKDKLYTIISEYEPKASFWKPSEDYLISSNINLNTFKDKISNIPLKNIFALAGYKTEIDIQERINEISNPQKRSRLQSILSDKTTKYINKVWNHKISFIVEISESGNCTISIKDDGINNQHDRHSMNARSEGFKQFISLILSISIESKEIQNAKSIIVIDEPENHLHPSGIRDLGKELLAIGENNFLFVSTHSPFLIDRDNQERHLIIKKNSNANTIKKEVSSYTDLRDDEVLSEAFGINIYKDLLNMKKLLVEGLSDKLILQKVFALNAIDYGITNGQGSNIVQIAARLNDDDISVLVLTDDDEDGKKYKAGILKIGGVFNSSNVFTLKDLAPSLVTNGTIEDCLGKHYVESQFKKLYKDKFGNEIAIQLDENQPFIEQCKIALQQKQKLSTQEVKSFLDNLKISISEDFSPIKSTWKTKFPILENLIDKIKERI